MQKLIIDTDPGVDDAQAIMMASAYPDVVIAAVTTVAGNVRIDRTTANACAVLDALGQDDVPVYRGCDRALVVPPPEQAFHIHGEDGLGNTNLPPSPRKVESAHAAVAIVHLANESPGMYTLVALAPLTNIAVALKLDPDLPSKMHRLVVMGGAIWSQGNTLNTLSAEFNVFSDPEAAHVVLDAWHGSPLDLVSWETTVAHPIPQSVVDRWRGIDSPRAAWFQRITRHFIDEVMSSQKINGMFAADPLAMAVALEPDIVRRAAAHYVSVELHGRHTRGQTTVDWNHMSGREPNANIVIELDSDRFFALMQQALQ